MKKRDAVLWILLAIITLTGTLNPTASVGGQSPPQEALGPGWHQGTAEPVPPAEARQMLSNRRGATAHTLAALPASETEATPEIQALARALEYDPKLIFDYVHNHIDYVPTFGSVNGATATLLAGRGNDWDQTSLFIALLRAAGYTADYVVGDVTYSTDRLANWLGVENAAVDDVLGSGGIPASLVGGGYRITRVWAEAEIGSQTYVFDPAMKTYTETTGIDLTAATGYDYDDFMTHAQEGAIVASDLVQDMNEANIQADLTTYSMNLVEYIQTQMPDATLAEVIGGREIVAAEMTSYPTELPHAQDVANESTYATVPDAYRHTLRVEHRGIDHVFRTYEIAGKRVSIFYDEADANRPILRVDGETIATGDATSPGGWYDATLTVDHPYAADNGAFADQWATTQLESGAAYVIVHDFNTASDALIASRNTLLTQYTHAGYADDSEPTRGEGLWLMALNYCYEDHLAADLISQVGNVLFLNHHTVGWMTQAASYHIDLPLSFTATEARGSGADSDAAYRTRAMMASALEHGMLEQMQGSDREAVSTIKVLQLNNQTGNLTFLADAGNWNSVKPNLKNYWPSDLAFIEDRIHAGYTLLLPEYGNLNLNQWHGSGYMGYKGSSMGMWVGGTYAGGMVTWLLDISLDALLDTLKEFGLLPDQEEETKTPESDDPVDMVTGAFHVTAQDIIAGPSGLLDVTFRRTYNSASNDSLGPLGYGWSHNQQVFLAASSDYAPGLGQRQPTDAAAFIVFAQVTLDVLEQEETIENWMTADLVTKWAMDQLIDNAITVHLSATSLGYVRLPDGNYNPPPGIHQALVQESDYYYVQGPGNTCMIFDTDGKGRVWLDANGNSLTYTYDGDGLLQSVGNATLGQTLTFSYTDERLTSVSDQAGRSVAFVYTDDELTSFRDTEGHAYQYRYDDAHRLVSITKPLSNTVVTNAYDDLGRVVTQTDAFGNTTHFYFSGFRNVEVYPDGSRQTHYIDAKGRSIALEDALGFRTQMTYDGQYRLRQQVNRLGDVTTYTYDPASGQLATLTNYNGESLTHTYTSQVHTFASPLDSSVISFTAHYLTRLDHPDGTYETFGYDTKGNMVSYTNQAGKMWEHAYNAQGELTQSTNPAGGQTQYTYHANGALASETDSDTGITTYGYDTYLRQTQSTFPDGSTVQVTYNLNDQVTSITDERGNTTTYTYDANRNLVTTTNPLNLTVSYTYDLMDQAVAWTDYRGKTTRYTYNEMNRLAAVTDPNGNTTQYAYDPRGWQDKTTDPAGKVWQTGYDNEGLIITSATPMDHVTRFERDARGDLITKVDPLGHTTTFRRDTMNRVTTNINPVGSLTSYTYDTRGQLASVTQPEGDTAVYGYSDLGLLTTILDLQGSAWNLDYSPMGRLQQQSDPLGKAWQYSYNQRGWLEEITYPTGETHTRTYDAGGNITNMQYTETRSREQVTLAEVTPDLHFTYDALNRLVATHGLSLAYNEASQVTGTTDQSSGITFEAAYDDGGRLKTVTYAGGLFTVTYQYDARDLLIQVSDDLTGATLQFTYDDDGRLIGMQRTNGVNAAFTWDEASRLRRIQEGALIDLQFTYDAAGQMDSQTYTLPLDPADDVTEDPVAFSFDAASQINDPGYTYDARGRLTASPQHTYTWNGHARLVGIDQDVTLSYNGVGDLLTRTVGSQTLRYYYNHALELTPIVAERDEGTEQFLRYYIWSPAGDLLYMIDAQHGNQMHYYHFDQAGSTLALTDESGALTDAYAYNPYGKLLHHQGNSPQPFTYVGRWGVRQEGESGTLYHMRNRYYDAVTTRFLSRDPVWPLLDNPAYLNPYQYVAQKPLLYVDPTGLIGPGDLTKLLGISNKLKGGVTNSATKGNGIEMDASETAGFAIFSQIPGSMEILNMALGQRGSCIGNPGQNATEKFKNLPAYRPPDGAIEYWAGGATRDIVASPFTTGKFGLQFLRDLAWIHVGNHENSEKYLGFWTELSYALADEFIKSKAIDMLIEGFGLVEQGWTRFGELAGYGFTKYAVPVAKFVNQGSDHPHARPPDIHPEHGYGYDTIRSQIIGSVGPCGSGGGGRVLWTTH